MEKIFDDYKRRLKHLKKKSYRENMEVYKAENEALFQDLLKKVNESENKVETASQIAEEMLQAAINVFGKNGKVSATSRSDSCFFMIYYVFPFIQLLNNDDSVLLCDAILDKWHTGFNNEAMSYTTYEQLYNSFNEKIFGIF